MTQSVFDVVTRYVHQESVLTDSEAVHLAQWGLANGWMTVNEVRAMAGLDGLTNDTSRHHAAPKKVACVYCGSPNEREVNMCEQCGAPMPITEG